MGQPEKLVIILTHGPDDPEMAALPLVMESTHVIYRPVSRSLASLVEARKA